MKKFKFTLQTVHNVRELRQEKEELILGQLQTEAVVAEEVVAQIESNRRQAIENYAQRLRSGEQLDPMEMELNSKHFESLNQRRKDSEQVVAQKKQACVRQSQAVVGAMREVKITGRLQETQKRKHDLEFARTEQNGIDELVSTRFARQKMRTK
jgi:flagellar export protein FliJ